MILGDTSLCVWFDYNWKQLYSFNTQYWTICEDILIFLICLTAFSSELI